MALKVKIILYVIITTAIIVVGCASYNINQSIKKSEQTLHNQITSLALIHSRSLSYPVWACDENTIRGLLNILTNYPNFLKAEIYDIQGKLLYEVGSHDPDPSSYITVSNNLFFMSSDNIPTKLGIFKLYASLNSLHEDNKQQIFNNIILFAALFTGLIITIFFSINKVTVPLEQMTQAILLIVAGNRNVEIPLLNRKDELAKVSKAISSFKEAFIKLEQLSIEIQEKNAYLEHHSAELKIAKEKALAADKAKTDFISNMSHELRTPMNAIIGMTDLALGASLEEKVLGWLEIVKKSALLQMDLINNIIDICKFEKTGQELYNVSFIVQKLIEEVTDIYSLEAEAKGIELIVCYDINDPVHTGVVGDSVKIKKTLINLVGNAIKFTLNGHVILRLKAQKNNDVINYRFAVEDTGIGISSDKIPTIFDKFSQIDSGSNRKYGGLGIGLNMSQEMVKMMGGEIKLESSVNVGSNFYFELNLPIDTKVVNTSFKVDGYKIISQNIVKELRILVVDDNEISRNLLTEYLSSWNIKHSCFDKAQIAFDAMIKASETDDPYHIALIDYRLPDFNGEILAEKIKSNPMLKNIPLILISALANNLSNSKNLRDIGFSGNLSKPFHPSYLWAALNLIWQDSDKEKKEFITKNYITNLINNYNKPKEGEVSFKGKKILVVEDVKMNQLLMQTILKKFGCEVMIAEDGQVGLEMSQKDHYDLIFMDHQMPRMDGVEVTIKIRELEKTTGKHIPIVAVTANATKEDREMYLSVGMDEFLQKPIKNTDISNTLSKFIG